MRIERVEWTDLALAGALVVVFGLAVYLPGQMERWRLADQLEHNKAELERELAEVAHLPRVQQQVARLERELRDSERVVPAQEETDHLVRRLSEALRRQGLDAEELVTHPPQIHEGYSAVRVRMAFGGSFAAVYGLLERIEAQPRLLRVERLDVEPARDGGEGLAVRLEVMAFTARMEEVPL